MTRINHRPAPPAPPNNPAPPAPLNHPAPPARINYVSAAEIVDLRHIRPKRAKLIRANEVDPRGTRVHRCAVAVPTIQEMS